MTNTLRRVTDNGLIQFVYSYLVYTKTMEHNRIADGKKIGRPSSTDKIRFAGRISEFIIKLFKRGEHKNLIFFVC